MLKNILWVFGVLVIAFAILTVSVLRTAAVKYSFSALPTTYPSNLAVLGENTEKIEIDYQLAYPGTVLPDHPLWIIKALRDRVWYTITTNSDKKAELNLLFADKRLSSAKILLERGKVELAVSTLTKAEKYLQKAWLIADTNNKAGAANTEFIGRLARASLVHRLVIEEMVAAAPEDVKPTLIQTEGYSKDIYKASADSLRNAQITPPSSPFESN